MVQMSFASAQAGAERSSAGQVLIFRPRPRRSMTFRRNHASSRGPAGQGEEIRESPLYFLCFPLDNLTDL